ncbi:MAG: VWA domain-containing protein, partial [Planctomycetales bacterium]|nr:VWA domain-containing protein [Planctomycetales bacterium]
LDADTGPNGLQNKPVITDTSSSRVLGRLNSTPNSVFEIDIYATDTVSALDAEGQTWIGSVTATTNSAGNATFSLDVPSLSTGFLTATATDAAGNTSEFSTAVEIVTPTIADLAVTITDNRSTVNPGDEVVYLVVVTNDGPDTVTGATVSTDIDLRLADVTYVSDAAGGATGNGSSLGELLQETLTLPPGSSVTYQITGNVRLDASGTVSKRVTVALPADVSDTNPLNNSDTDTTLIDGVISSQTFLVTNTNDSGSGSLRAAILASNSSLSSSNIQFAIPVTDPNFINIDSPADTGGDAEGDIFVIRPLTPLPSLSNSSFSITIDGGSQAAFLSETNPLGPEIVLDGSLLGGSGSTNSGLRVVSDANAISGLSIQNFRDAGLVISGDANSIFANYIGVDPTGRAARGNQVAGIVIAASASQNMIGGDQMSSGNLISGNAVGIEISGTQTQVQGNLIGTDITGTVAIPNLADGIVLKAGATHTTIGGVSALDGNFVLASDDRVTATVSSITLAEGTSEIRGSVFHDENANGVRDTDLVVGGEPDIVIVLDRSGSMSDPFGSVNGNARPISRLDAAIEGIIKLLDTLVQRGFGDEVEVSVVSFSDSGTPLDLDPTAPGTQDFTSLTADRDGNGVLDIIQALGKVAASGSTNYEAALRTATAVLRAHASLAGQSNVIFLSDGEPQSGSYGDEATTLRQMGTNLQAFGIGAEVPLDALQIIDANTQRIENTEQFVSVFTGADPSSVTFVEPGLANRLVYLDTNKNGRLDPSERSTVTDLTGEYTFAGLPPGTYSVVVDTRLGASNLISGNAGNGVTITQQGTAFNSVLGNLIGTDLHGESALANGGSGIAITAGASSNVIGGGTGATQNVISGNTAYGIILSGVGTISNIVQGNMIGTNIRGTNKLANETGGVSLTGGASSNTIGGTAVATRNVISGNNGSGVSLSGSNTLSNTIQGNHIGTDASGTMVVGSEDVAMETPSTTVASEDRIGIVISNGASHNIVEARNIISGNADGGISILGIESTGNLIRGNVIGTGVVRSQQIGNGGQGVVIQDASGNVIGGLDASDGNIIAFNHRNGVLIISGERNRILSNSIFGNYALGIDLGADGPTANDSRDEDTGPNQLQNKPEQLTAAVTSAGETVTVKAAFSLPTATTLTGPITIQFFLADLDGQEGSTLIGVDEVTAISPGARYESTLDPSSFTKINVQGNVLVATATDSQGNTSEFSDVAFIQPPPNTPQQLNDAAQAILNRASTSIQSTLDLEPPDIGSIDLPLPMKLESGDKTFLGIVDIELSESRAKTPDAMQRIHFQFLGSEAFTKSDLQTILANDNGSAEFEKQLFGGRVDLGENLVAFIWVDPPAWSVKTSTTSEPVFDSELRQSTPDGGAKFSTGAFRQDVLESIVTPFSDRETLSVSLTPPQGEPYRGGVNIYALVDGRYQLNYRTTFDSSGLVEHSQLDLLFRPSRAPRQLLVFAPHTSTSTTPEQDLSTKITAVDAPAPLTRFVSQEAIGSRYYDSVAGSQMDLEEQLLRTLEELLEGLKGIWEDLQQSVGGLSNLGVETMQRLKSGSSLQALSRRFLAISNGPDTAEATSAAYGIRRILLDAWSAIANQAIASEPRPAATEPPDAVESSQSVDGTDSMKQTAAALPTTETSTTTNASSGE